MDGMGKDALSTYNGRLKIEHYDRTFKSGPRFTYIALRMTIFLYAVLGPFMIVALIYYVSLNQDSFNSGPDIVLFYIGGLIVSILLFPVIYAISLLQSLRAIIYVVNNKTIITMNDSSIDVEYSVHSGWDGNERICTSIPFERIVTITLFPDLTFSEKLKYVMKQNILLFRWTPKGALHSGFTSPRDIVFVDLDQPLEFVKFNGGSLKKGNFKMVSSEKISFEIRRKDRPRFLKLLERMVQ